MDGQLSETSIRLLAATDWWIDLLLASTERMGEYLDDQARARRLVEDVSDEDVAKYRLESQLDRALGILDDRSTFERRLEVDALFVAGALYQVNAYLGRLARLSLWRGGLASAGNRFREAYRSQRIKDLRDLIEHSDEHMALQIRRIAEDFDSPLGVKTWGRAGDRGIGLETIYVFGTGFEVLDLIDQARQVQTQIEFNVPNSMVPSSPPWE